MDQQENVIKDEQHVNFVIEDELAVSTVNLKVFFWVDTLDYRSASKVLRGKVIRKVKEALESNGFNLPADIKELKIYRTQGDFPLRIKKDPNDRESGTKN